MNYYGQTKKTALQALDWESISSSISSGLTEERDRRQELKDQIDQDSRDFAKSISEAPTGQNATFNQKILELSDDMSNARLMQDKLLKSGQLKLRDYRVMRQNLKDGLSQLYEFSNGFNDMYNAKMERATTGKSSKIESYMMENLEQLKDFTNSNFIIDPETGNLLVAKNRYDDAGNLLPGVSTNPNDYGTIASLSKRMGMDIDKFDVGGYLKPISESFGKYTEMFSRAGLYGTIDDITSRQDLDPRTGGVVSSYIKAENGIISAAMQNPFSAGSVLMDYVGINPDTGNEYRITFDPAEAESNQDMVLLMPDPNAPGSGLMVPKLSKQQEGVVEEAMRYRLRSMLDKEQRVSGRYPAPSTPSASARAYERNYARGVQKNADILSNLAQLYYGSQEDMTSALEFIQGNNPDILDIRRTNEGVEFTYKTKNGSESKILPFTNEDGSIRSQESFLRGAAAQMFGIDDVDEALSRSQYNPDMEFSENVDAEFRVSQDLPEFNQTTIDMGGEKLSLVDYVNSVSTNLPGWGDTEEESAKYWAKHLTDGLIKALPSEKRAGLSIVSNGRNITFTYPSGETMVVSVTSDTPSEDIDNILPKFEEFYNKVVGMRSQPTGGESQAQLDNQDPLGIL